MFEASSNAAARMREYESWSGSRSLSSIGFRWLIGPQALPLVNGPAMRLHEELQLDEGARILDIGCGRGALLGAIDEQLQPATAPIGLDGSRAILRLAARDQRNAERPLVQGSALALPFAADTFTLALCSYVAKDLDDAELNALFVELLRVLKAGGLAVVWEFGPTGNARIDAWNAARDLDGRRCAAPALEPDAARFRRARRVPVRALRQPAPVLPAADPARLDPDRTTARGLRPGPRRSALRRALTALAVEPQLVDHGAHTGRRGRATARRRRAAHGFQWLRPRSARTAPRRCARAARGRPRRPRSQPPRGHRA